MWIRCIGLAVMAWAVAGCGGLTGNGTISPSGVAGNYAGSYLSSSTAFANGIVSLTIDPSGNVTGSGSNSASTVTFTFAGTMQTGGAFTGSMQATVTSGTTSSSDTYGLVGSFQNPSPGALSATIASSLTTGTTKGTTMNMTLTLG